VEGRAGSVLNRFFGDHIFFVIIIDRRQERPPRANESATNRKKRFKSNWWGTEIT